MTLFLLSQRRAGVRQACDNGVWGCRVAVISRSPLVLASGYSFGLLSHFERLIQVPENVVQVFDSNG